MGNEPDRDVALEALGALLKGHVTSHQKQGSQAQDCVDGPTHHPLCLKHMITKVYHAHRVDLEDVVTHHIIDEDHFFAPEYDYDFTNLKDTKTYYRGGEVYGRPCGWHRYALKVLDKYDDNTWLGTLWRSTQSVSGEWPVSFHGTSKQGAEGIIEENYKPGSGEVFGHGIYSTPLMEVAEQYAFPERFTSEKTGKTYEVVLQNRINPKYREKHNNDEYWLVPIPKNASYDQVHEIVDKAIRPYGLLLKEV